MGCASLWKGMEFFGRRNSKSKSISAISSVSEGFPSREQAVRK